MNTFKMTSIAFFTVAMGVGAVAFGGCTVTSGTVNDDGGVGSSGTSGTGTSGTSGTSGTPTEAGAACGTAEGNKQTVKIVNDACQACLAANCCAELKGCFNIDTSTAADAGFIPDNCDKFTTCIANSKNDQDQQDCQDVTTKEVVDAYYKIFDTTDATSCLSRNKACDTACQ